MGELSTKETVSRALLHDKNSVRMNSRSSPKLAPAPLRQLASEFPGGVQSPEFKDPSNVAVSALE